MHWALGIGLWASGSSAQRLRFLRFGWRERFAHPCRRANDWLSRLDTQAPFPILCLVVLAGSATPAADIIPEHLPYRTTLTITNPYARAVNVQQVDSTCTCSELVIGDRFLLPGGSTTLAATVDNRNHSGDQRIGISVYLTDPAYEPIEAELRWTVQAAVLVDGVPPGADPRNRPADRAWQDVYRYVANERPDEPQRLRKRIRIAAPAESTPSGGLLVTAIDYRGSIWDWTSERLDTNVWLISGAAKPGLTALPIGTHDEAVVIRTNHPHKPTIELSVIAVIDPQAGRRTFDSQAIGE